jgi:hypothetical protein
MPAPSEKECTRIWDRYGMPEHIREHSRKVGIAAASLAELAQDRGVLPPGLDPLEVRASGLLHDLAKEFSIRRGGLHAQIGAAWARAETGNPRIAQGVLHHVWWPLEDVDPRRHFLPLAVLYADKRVMHEDFVSLGERYTDLFERYAKNDFVRERIKMSLAQAKAVELTLGELIGVDLNASTFDSRGLVQRA